ncbi:translation initiation factor IF-2 [Lysinibacillus sp. FSL R7-0073]|uniref:Translation initiation factor IF-2 n=1 Tax=Lysinibacillus fusiformis TaxID=28031 RepID=A0A1E4R468_9BACI|nr:MULTISPECIES: translation initiation factor IF-2 [Lysinibacillus]MBD8520043.1 translation initiation factor IF-2 [Lysinibacillus fusiformis]MED4887950.1 translation initiation factor IF-2 [Lysinibacillus fusiformis]ODV55250.1 translation initiation factor IF-2 [Lysinibacillus fusiformis]WKT78141.1 translation initiation factor IF-2 [Lysinibacillus fusiformis]
MTKIRVHEYAKQVNKTSKEVIEALSKLNVSVTNHMSMLERDIVSKLNQTFKATPEKNVGKQATQNISQKPQSNGQQNHSVKKQEGQRQQSATSKPKANNQQHSNSSNEKSKNTKGNQNRNMTQNNNNNNNNNNRRGGGGYNQRPKPGIHGGKRRHPKTHQPSIPLKQKELPEKITFVESLSVAELAKKLHREPSEIIKKLFMLGVMATINQELDKDAIELICTDYGVEVEEEIRVDITDLETHFEQTEEVNEAELSERPPVVTIMGHVDHGKTTLLDSIRNTKVTAGEAGGITQHIGAYQVTEGDKKITFLDTPGHAAFTTMRARGAKVTDLTILVVAADDGVMPQTVEAINHAKAAEVPIIVAVNKMDKPSANPDRVMQELTEHGLVPEAWGGETIFVPISALKGEGIDTLLEMILLVAEVGELKANPDRLALGTVIEAQLDKGRGSVATLLVQDGTLKVGDPIVVGHTFGRVRAMVNDKGRRVKEAGPSTPVEITGLNDVPQAGDRFVVFEDEKTARQVGETRAMSAIQAQRSEKQRVTLDNLFEQMSQGEMKELNLIVKADVQGTVEAMAASLMKIDVEGVNVKIIHTGAGAITESDISLAAASNAIVIGFNVRPDVNAKRAAEEEGVDIRLHRIIYKVIEEIEQAMKGMLDPEFEEKIIGQAEVRQTIKVSKVGTIAGSYITEGKVTRDSGVRVIRDNVVIFEGELDTLKRFKDEVKEVARGYECGITITNFNDIKEGDIIEAYIMEEVKRV